MINSKRKSKVRISIGAGEGGSFIFIIILILLITEYVPKEPKNHIIIIQFLIKVFLIIELLHMFFSYYLILLINSSNVFITSSYNTTWI